MLCPDSYSFEVNGERLGAREMINNLRLKNFRGFDDHTLPLGPTTVIVGENNAGKTTIVEALRLVSMVTLRYKRLSFRDPPTDADIPRRCVGVSPSMKNVEISFDTVFHQYREPPAIIIATFDSGASITIYIFPEKLHAVIEAPDGKIIRNRSQANKIDLPSVRIMPQVAPLQRTELRLSDEYVMAAMSSRLAPLHFRNQLRIRTDLFAQFKRVVEDTWPGVQIRELVVGRLGSDEPIRLHVRNDSFVAEVAEMGHGLQMWLQTMWFLTLAQGTPTVILDEPDVYMHADLQRRIIRFLRHRHTQTIVTTHSVEIMSEVQPDEILVVDKRRHQSSFAGSVPAVQVAINRCGSVHNIHLTRLLGARRMILVEGKDIKFLKEFQDTLFPKSATPFQSLPNMPIGGWGGWKYAVGGTMVFQNALGQDIRCYCILDSDYYSPGEIASRYREARQKGVQLHIWKWKEIENYLLVPDTISRYIAGKVANRVTPPTPQEIGEKLVSLADNLKDSILDALATALWTNDRSLRQTGANRAARQRLQQARKAQGNITSLASGKQLLSGLSAWAHTEFGVSLSGMSIARSMTAEEIHAEVVSVVTAIEDGGIFCEDQG